MKNKLKQLIAQILITSTFFLGLIYVCEQSIIKMTAFWTDFLVMHTDTWMIKVLVAKAEEELPMREWVLREFEKNNINPKVADCVIQQESQWQDQRTPSPTKDYGLMQWNIQHIKSGLLDMKCAYDYPCAVQKAIVKIKADKGWGAWYGYKDANCGRFGDSLIK